MQFTSFNIVENNIKKAQFKLSEHRVLGEKSPLTVVQVARLMDKLNGKNKVSKKEYLFNLN